MFSYMVGVGLFIDAAKAVSFAKCFACNGNWVIPLSKHAFFWTRTLNLLVSDQEPLMSGNSCSIIIQFRLYMYPVLCAFH